MRARARQQSGVGAQGRVVLPSLSERESLRLGGVSAKAADIWPDGRRPSSVKAAQARDTMCVSSAFQVLEVRFEITPGHLFAGKYLIGGANNQPQGRCCVGRLKMCSSHLQQRTTKANTTYIWLIFYLFTEDQFVSL